MAHQPRGLTDHEELEMLLESFSKQVEEIVSELDTMTVSFRTGFSLTGHLIDIGIFDTVQHVYDARGRRAHS